MIYLDNSATTRQYDEVTELIYRASKEDWGNPSSLHKLGFAASTALKDSRRGLQNLLHGDGQLIFTSSGTESDNMALISTANKMRKRGRRIITTKVEHPAVLETCRRLSDNGFVVTYLDVDDNGFVDPRALAESLTDDTILVSIMTVNNETGTIEPAAKAAELIKEYNNRNGSNIVFHTDAVQAFGKLRFDGHDFDLVSASAHKFHGPKGAGFLYMRKDLRLPAFITGGGQEEGYRSSTENTIGIAGMSMAAELSYWDFDEKMERMAKVNDYLYSGLRTELEDVRLDGPKELGFTLDDYGKRCPSVLNLRFANTRGEVLLHTLEQDGIYVSTGSACASHKTADSHVLQAMGLSHKDIEGAIRFSFSEYNEIEEMDYVIDRTAAAVKRFRKLGSFR